MRDGYNSSDYWDRLNEKNKTIRGHMFMDDIPRKESIYIHTLAFSKNNGLRSVWAYFPGFSAVVGYIQYSFLQECFYKWIYGRNKKVTKIPSLTVEKIIQKALRENKVSKAEAQMMRDDITSLQRIWKLPEEKGIKELKSFCRQFNRKWYGDSTEFLYVSIFKTPEEMGEYIVKSCKLTSVPQKVDGNIIYDEEHWMDICRNAIDDVEAGETFRTALLKSLTEIL